ncbi:HYR domain-containing protein [Algibacter sp. R77976]|uniref:HYR domain-containing protein n=1 Tax=Algibacter sp. R77976 TaxID=3093873 RepID=UPI0037C8997D
MKLKITQTLILICISLSCFINAQQSPSIQTGVTFQWLDTQANLSDPATIKSVTIDGTIYNTFVVPSDYELTRLGSGGHGPNKLIENGVNLATSSNDPNWNNLALSAFQDKNLNHYFNANPNGDNICKDFDAVATTDAQKQTIFYDPAIPSNQDGVLAVTERGANNCFYVEIWGIPATGGTEQKLGQTFVRNNGNYTNCTFAAPNPNSDYWRSGRCNENNQTIGIGLFYLSDIAPTGSKITKIEFVGASNDHGDGKFFLLQKYAVDENNTNCINETYNGNLHIGNNVPENSTYSLVSGPTPSGDSFTLNSDGTYTYVPTTGYVGDVVFDYEVCLPAPNTSVCDQATVTLSIIDLPPEPTFSIACGSSNDDFTIEVLSPLGGEFEYSIDNGNTFQDTTEFNSLPEGNYNLVIKNIAADCLTYDSNNPIVLDNLELTGSETDISCEGDNNGSISIDPSGGTLPYTYLWSNSETTKDLTNLSAGSYTVTVTDANGCTISDDFSVSLLPDNIDPTITCPTDVSVNVDAGTCAATSVALGTPTTNDNCSVASVNNDAPASFPLGDTTVTWTVTDGSGRTATCTQTVTVIDNIDPTITCPTDVSVNVDAGTCTATSVALGTPTTNDNCSVASVDNDAPASFPLGDTTVTWTVTDGSGRTATCTQTVTIIDNIDPTITCPTDVSVNVDTGTCAATSVALATPTTDDNCSVASVDNDAPASFPLGDTTVTWTVTDGSGRTATCTQTVTVIDNIDPTITCPTDVSVNVDAGTCATDAGNVTLGTPTTNDNCTVASVNNDAPASFPLGDTTVTWTVTDGSGRTATCTQTVTVIDNIDPTITCPTDVSVNVDAGTCTTDAGNVTLGTPTTNDNCSVASVDNDAPASFPLGDTTVTWTVTDGSGRTATCTQTVTVIDNIDPTITCPTDVSVNVDAGTCAATSVALGTPTTNDNCSVASVDNDAPASLPLGDTTVTWTVTDGSGRTATCTQTVTVIDNIDPTITCPTDVSVNVDAGTCATDAGNVILGTPTTNDNCSVASVDNDAPASFPLGDTTVTWTVTDGSGRTATCTQTVTVIDNIDPTITCPTDVSVNIDITSCDTSSVNLGTPTTDDNCSVASVNNDAPTVFPLGDTIVTWTVTDGSGNTATCEQTVTVTDNIDPSITCPADVEVNVDNDLCTASNVEIGTATTSDCAVAEVTNDAPSIFPLGVTTVTWTVTDASGNTATCEQTVTVIDNINPTITCPNEVSVNMNATGCDTDIADVNLGTPTVDDNCTETTITNDAPTTFPLGDTIVTWTVTDGSGNTATCTQTVTIIDDTAPTFVECAAPVSVNMNATGCDTDIADVNLGTPTVDDNCTETTITNDAPTTFPLGDTIVTWTVTDGSGNTATCTQTVTIIDDTAPTFVECAAPVSVNMNATGCDTDIADVDLGTPTVDDNCAETTITNDAPTTFPLGDTIVTWTVTDGSGNTATCTQTVTIIDDTAPTFVECAAPVSVNMNATGCDTDIADVNLGTPTVDDNCTETTITNDAPTTFPLGDTIVTWTVTDGSGNTATCTQTVTIIDDTAPTFVECAAPVSVNMNATGCDTDIADVNLGTPTVDDNCTETTITNDAPTTFPLGDTIVTWTVTDGSGNTATCTQTVTIIDDTAPTFVECAAPVSVNMNATGCDTDIADVNLGTPTVDDNCTETTITNDAPTTFPLGDTIVTWTVTDGSGNTATCAQTVTIIDDTAPTFVECAAPVSVNMNATGCDTDIADVNLGTPTVDDNCTETTITNDAPTTFPLGDTIVTWTVTDGSGNTATCTQTVTIIDDTAPTFVECAAPVSVNMNATGCDTDIADVNLGTPTVDDNCTETTITNDAPTTFPLGDTIVTWTVTDGSGNTATCTQTVTIIDDTAPTFVECAAPVSVNMNATGCDTDIADVNLGTPTVDDNCTETTITNDAPTTFPLGDTIVTWTVTDGSGNTATCTQTVTIIDDTAPTFVECAAPVSVNMNATGCDTDIADVDLGTPTVDDNCAETTITNDAPTTFPLGDTIVTWTVTDGSGNTATCTQTVTIIDDTAPTFVECAAPVSVNMNATGCDTDIADVNLGTPTVDDNCTETTITNDAPTTFPLGDTIVTWTVTDGSGNTATCTQTVTIIDDTAPTFVECAAPVSVNMNATGCDTDIADVNLGTPTVDDNCTETTITNDAPTTFPLGDTIVTWTVTDGSGNTATCTQTVTIIDDTAPTFVECAAPVSVNMNATGCDTDIADVNLGTPTVDDNCTETTITNDAPTTFPLGDTIVTWTVTDGSGNTATCTQTVTIIDDTAPTFVECAAPVSVNMNATGCDTDIADVNLGTPTVDDNCTETTITNDAPTTFPLGDTIVTWTVTDGSGNTATCAQTVTIIDDTAPTFVECAAPVSVNMNATGCDTDIADVNLGTPTVDDNCTETTITNDAPTTFPLGDTIVTWTVTDGSGNTATCTQTVTIIDDTAPTFVECAAPVSVNMNATGCDTDIADVNLGTPTVDDNCTETTITNDAPTTFPLGDTIVTWTVTDGSGNTATCTQTVTIIDDTAPTFVECAAPVSVNMNATGCDTDIADVNLGTPTVDDNCTETTITNDAPTTFPLGDTIVTWTVTDGSGNTATCTQTVTIIDDTAPTFVECAAPVSVNMNATGCDTDIADVNLGTPTVDDNCTETTITNDAPTTFPLGDTIVTWTVTDGSGNTATCTQTVTIIDDTAPTFVECAAPVSVNMNATGCDTDIADVNLGTPTVDDNCTETTITNDAPTTFPLGDTIVTWTVTDGSGNTATCTQTVTIIDDTAPTFVECAAPVSVNMNATGCDTDIADVNLGTPTVDDNCTETTITNDAPTTFPLGDTIVTWTVTDGSGNTATCTQTVTIIDDTAPTFVECAAPVSVNMNATGCDTDIADVNLGTPTVDDNCTETTITNDAPTTFPLGDTIVTWTVTDGSGNTATCTQTVTIIDDTAPTFVECAAPVSLNVDADGCTTDISNIDLGIPTVDDNCTETTITNDAPDTFPLGETIVTWMVTDGSGNTATCEQTVTIIDNVKPIFIETLPTDATYECDSVPDAETLTATDPCGDVDVVFTETRTDGSCISNYSLERKWVATDQNGLTTTHIQTITVQDTKAPEPTTEIESSIIVNCEDIPEVPTIEFIDNCSANVNVIFNETSSFEEDNPSDYRVTRTWTVSDDCDNSQVFIQIISVTLNDFITTINDSACTDDGIIDLNDYLDNDETEGEWVLEEGNAVLNDSLLDPENIDLGNYKFTYTIFNNGCLETIEVILEINDDCIVLPCNDRDQVIISKVVTPNGDTYNDFFTVNTIEGCEFVVELQIFNRWGAKIYDNSNYQNDWNGYAHNASVGRAEKVPNGTYYYIINLKNSGLEPFAKAFYVGTK